MAGHSKWNNIKNKKGAADAKKATAFTQVSKLVRVAVKEGGSDNPQFNASLRVALDKARAANMPKDKIQRALERGMGKTASGAQVQEILYEGFASGGVPIIIAAVTDNPNRTSSEVKFMLSRAGGSLGGPGSAMYMFQRSNDGQSYTPTMEMNVDEEHLQKLEELVETLRENEDVEDVYTAVNLDATIE